jgi:hypothetical protein
MIWDPEDDLSDTALDALSCGPDEIRSLTTGRSFDSVAEALEEANAQDEICIGEGEFEVGVVRWAVDSSSGAPSLALRGAGSGLTVLRGSSGWADVGTSLVDLHSTESSAALELEGLSFDGLVVDLQAATVNVSDLDFTLEGGSSYVVSLDAGLLDASGLSMVGADGPLGVPWVLRATQGTVRDLTLTDNVVVPGYLLEIYGNISLVDPVISRNLAMSDEIGLPAIMAYGNLHVVGGELSANSFNGPAIWAWQLLDLQGLMLERNDGPWMGTVVLEQDALVASGRVDGNVSASGAFLLNEGASLQLDSASFGIGEDRNLPCDVAMLYSGDLVSQCIALELGEDSSVYCDALGCR